QVPVEVGTVTVSYVITLVGGCLFGYTATRLGIVLLTAVRELRRAELSVAVAMPYVVFIVAEQMPDVSGVLAVGLSGLTLNMLGPARLRPEDWDYIATVWDQLAFWAGTLLFTFAALLVPRLLGDMTLLEAGLIVVVIVAALVARAIMIWGVLPLLAAV